MWSKYWSFSFSSCPSNEYSGLISFRIDLFDLLAVQETLKSLLQHHSSKALVLRCSVFFMVQLSALPIETFVGKVMSLLFNMLFKACHSFSSKKHASFNFTATVTICSDFRAPQNKVSNYFHCFPIYLPWSDETRCHDIKFSECWALSQLFHSPLSLSSRGFLVPLHFLP